MAHRKIQTKKLQKRATTFIAGVEYFLEIFDICLLLFWGDTGLGVNIDNRPKTGMNSNIQVVDIKLLKLFTTSRSCKSLLRKQYYLVHDGKLPKY